MRFLSLVELVAGVEPRVTRDDVDAALCFAVVVYRRDQARAELDVAEPDLLRANRVLGNGGLPQHGPAGLVGAPLGSPDHPQAARRRLAGRHGAPF
jgi:hypothetical protein